MLGLISTLHITERVFIMNYIEYNKKDVGERIKKLRKEKGMSQEKLAGKLHCNRNTLVRIENGSQDPDVIFIMNFAIELDTTVNYILYGNAEDYPARFKRLLRDKKSDELEYAYSLLEVFFKALLKK